MALWVLTLREPQRGASDGLPQPVVRPHAWRDFGRELMAILPPLTVINTARIPGALTINLVALAIIAAVAGGLAWLTENWAQWAAYGLGVYAVFSWVQSLRQRDPPTYRLIWGSPMVILMVVAFGSISFVTYAGSFWGVPYVLRTFYPDPTVPALYIEGLRAAEEVATILGWSAAISAAVGVITGGILSDWWRRHDPRGRLFVNMIAALAPAPIIFVMFTTDNLATFYWLNPFAHIFSSLWVGAAVATLQDVVLPRMRRRRVRPISSARRWWACSRPLLCGKIADIAGGNLQIGVFALYIVPPFTVVALWIAGGGSPSSRRPKSTGHAQPVSRSSYAVRRRRRRRDGAPLFPLGSVR